MLHDEVRALADVVSPADHDRVMAIADEVGAVETALGAECPGCGTVGALTCMCGRVAVVWEWPEVAEALKEKTDGRA